MRRCVVGYGYLGQRVAAQWLAAGDTVFVTTRSKNRAAGLQEAGFCPIVCDVTQPDSLGGLRSVGPVDAALFAVGIDRSSGSSVHEVYVQGLSHVIEALPSIERLVYISSTGVYGQSHGEWVDELTECQPTRPGGAACLAAERMLETSRLASRAIILRLAGIYGPGRVPNRGALESGQPITAPEGSFLNLIHVDDAVTAVIESARCAVPPTLFVVSDKRPVERREYYRELARLIGADEAGINFVNTVSQPNQQRKVGSKRVRSDKIISALQLKWQYPSYREGLAAIVEGDAVERKNIGP